jgi:hypothetical protein
MSFIFAIETTFSTEFVGKGMIYLHTKFHEPNSNVSLLEQPEVAYKFNAAAISLAYILQGRRKLNKR